jgi:dihydroneopterin triphosphate diphosphatase
MIKYSIECWLYNDIEDRFLLLRCPVTIATMNTGNP